MDKSDEIFIVVKSISNTVNTISELNDLIKSDRDGLYVVELKRRQNQLIGVLQRLTQDLEKKTISHFKE